VRNNTGFDSTLGVGPDYPIIVFCSGEECDLSLHLARNMQAVGYTNVAIFFGGAREWEKFGFEVERRRQCGG
jgi:3-mercaptopyruvate sulfurtransferase SseA